MRLMDKTTGLAPPEVETVNSQDEKPSSPSVFGENDDPPSMIRTPRTSNTSSEDASPTVPPKACWRSAKTNTESRPQSHNRGKRAGVRWPDDTGPVGVGDRSTTEPRGAGSFDPYTSSRASFRNGLQGGGLRSPDAGDSGDRKEHRPFGDYPPNRSEKFLPRDPYDDGNDGDDGGAKILETILIIFRQMIQKILQCQPRTVLDEAQKVWTGVFTE